MPLRLRWAKSSSTLVGSNKGRCRPQDHTWGRHVSVHAVATSCTLTARRSECSTRRGARHRLPVAWALTSYEVLVASKKFTTCKVSLAVAIHLAGLTTRYSGSNPSSSRRRSARYLT